MSNNNNNNIALFGLGTVGLQVYKQITENKKSPYSIVSVVVKDKEKQREIPNHLISYDRKEVFENESVGIIIEVIDDADEAFAIAQFALRNNKVLISANKKMLASNLPTLYSSSTAIPLWYEAAVGGSIPIIQTLNNYYRSENISKVQAILNGTSNFILTQIFAKNKTYAVALKEAQALGFAESDPTNDVEGFDAAYKLILVAKQVLNIHLTIEQIVRIGISKVNNIDIVYAKANNLTIKLLASIIIENNLVQVSVLPTLISKESALAQINNETNAVNIISAGAGSILLTGPGAGGVATASAVVKNIDDAVNNLTYTFSKESRQLSLQTSTTRKLFISSSNKQNLADISSANEIISTDNLGYYMILSADENRLQKLIEQSKEKELSILVVQE
jgi:homoserine dehydrogenase